MRQTRRRRTAAAAPDAAPQPAKPAAAITPPPQDVLPPSPPPAAAETLPKPAAIPPRTWQVLQEAGEKAAERLRDLLASQAFAKMKPTDQARLIELALTRAYGAPVSRSIAVTATSDSADAVAAVLARMASAPLPEMTRRKPA